ncbi:Tetratricopeptide TPR_2 repeat protein [Minicystis rosea]|nr:Tetratricopeptide TPR_2 repeat protein [Minicystis rosea]
MGLAALVSAAPCRADDQQAFELAKNPFDAGQFAEAHTRLSALLDPALPSCESGTPAGGRCHIADPDLVERARALDAASLLALRREAEADAQIGKILRANPQYAPNTALFPQEVVDRFTMVRGALRPELEAIAQQKARDELQKRVAGQKAREAEEKWLAELERLAGEERRIEPNSRWIAMVPFGVGQFQNGDVRLGVVFAAGEVLLGGASLVTVAVVNRLASSFSVPNVDKNALSRQIKTVTTVNQITFAAWAAVTVAGVLQAQFGFVPERTTTVKRPIPPRPKIAPVAAPVPGGAIFGVTGTF